MPVPPLPNRHSVRLHDWPPPIPASAESAIASLSSSKASRSDADGHSEGGGNRQLVDPTGRDGVKQVWNYCRPPTGSASPVVRSIPSRSESSSCLKRSALSMNWPSGGHVASCRCASKDRTAGSCGSTPASSPSSGKPRYATRTVSGGVRAARRELEAFVEVAERRRPHAGSVAELLDRWLERAGRCDDRQSRPSSSFTEWALSHLSPAQVACFVHERG